jgi:hypothetical protein
MGTDRGLPVSCSGTIIEDSVDGFYSTFVQWCRDNTVRIVPQAEFMKEIDQMSMAMRKQSILPLKYESLVRLHYKTQFGSDMPQWVNLGEPAFKGPVISLGKLEDWKDIQVGQGVVKSNRDDFRRSESQLEFSQSPSQQEDEEEYEGEIEDEMGDAMVRDDTRGVAIRGMNLRDIVRMSRGEDARDEFMPIRYDEEDEIVDEDEQDEEAYRKDQRAKKRQRNQFISNQAEEVEEIESSGMDEEEAAQLIGEGLMSPSKYRGF